MSTVDEAWLDTRQDCPSLSLSLLSASLLLSREKLFIENSRERERQTFCVLHQFSILRKRV